MPATSYNKFYVGDSIDHKGFGSIDEFKIIEEVVDQYQIKCLADKCESEILCDISNFTTGMPTCASKSNQCTTC